MADGGREVRTFALAVKAQWVAFVTSTLVAAILGALPYFVSHQVQEAYWLGMIAAFIPSFYFVWRDEYRMRIDTERRFIAAQAEVFAARLNLVPNVICRIEKWRPLNFYIDPNGMRGSNIVLDVTIRNSGARTALTDWTLKLPSISITPIPAREDLWQQQILRIHRLHDLAAAARVAIGQGDVLRGSLIFNVPGLHENQLQMMDDPKLVLSFSDAAEKTYTVQWPNESET